MDCNVLSKVNFEKILQTLEVSNAEATEKIFTAAGTIFNCRFKHVSGEFLFRGLGDGRLLFIGENIGEIIEENIGENTGENIKDNY